ncbi:HTTM domain-containing protein [Bizionia saleffrena]|uniref:HTTM domain-containing protein n=1 Tax=Bizionia saleffrena TaxID=291189 RepID=A0A8H2QLV9_9FLAO|nr:HTTM domain-containing protein [Bizionia saleffrena]TYB76049.1 HTTM domain-containing protein [Bizionia saleffrena]
MLNAFLFKYIDNSALVVFRIIFGLLVFLESVGSIFTGWITRTLVEPEFTFSFIGFEWLQPLPGNWMYVYYLVMGLLGLLIMVGYKYRMSMISFTLLWCGVYFMQKSSYNNHYYLLILLSAIMCTLPANRYASIDVKLNPSLKQLAMPSWCKWVFVLQLLILYTYAAIAKLYPDWLDLTLPTLLMEGKKNYPIIGAYLQHDFVPYLIAYGGILFDGLIIPLLLFKKTRKYAFFASIFFHLFNSIVFQVGVFPYLSLAFSLFFFEPEVVRRLFLKKKPAYTKAEIIVPHYKPILLAIGSVYFVVQVLLPIRHHFIQDDVLWTEEGHRMSWRMMLRSKSGMTSYRVIDKKTGETTAIHLSDYLTAKQTRLASSKPDAIWQFSQHLKEDFKAKGQDVSVFVDCKVSVNRKPYQTLINPAIDMGSVKWHWFKHNEWLLPSK